MKAWNVVHQSFPRESVNSYIQRNKLDKSYTSYYSIQTSNSKPLDPPSQSCTLSRDKIIWDWKGVFKEKLEKTILKNRTRFLNYVQCHFIEEEDAAVGWENDEEK